MRTSSALPLPETPDLLRRFVPTPHEISLICDGWEARVRTNQRFGEEVPPMEHPPGKVYGGTLIRDPDLPAVLGALIVARDGEIVYVSFGPGCMLAIDLARYQMTGFISAAIGQSTLETEILPVVIAAAGMSR